MPSANGKFTVELTKQSSETETETGLGRMLIAKRFEGPLQAESKGQMLSMMTETKGSAGYVAIERVTGTLDGRRGSFVLQHHGLMNRGVGTLIIDVVPNSGTGELTGLGGKMAIDIVEGAHFYRFEYALAHS